MLSFSQTLVFVFASETWLVTDDVLAANRGAH